MAATSTRDLLLKLDNDRAKLEAKISEYGAVLQANHNVGMDGQLLDAEGFPRSDIDVYQVRQARQQIICLQNDHKDLMKRIEQLLHKLHAETPEENQDILNGTTHLQINEPAPTLAPPLTPIAIVNVVSPASPAEEAGICVGDRIIQFGSINSNNFGKNLMEIGGVVRHMENQRVAIKVLRNDQKLDLILIPKVWSGQGLLGCNIVLAPVI